jgi:hypothetical protein
VKHNLVEVGAAEKVAAGSTDEFAAAILEAGRAGGAEDRMVLVSGQGAESGCGFDGGFRG